MFVRRTNSRILTLCLLVLCGIYAFADPGDEAQRIADYHERLQRIGIGPATSINVLLRDGETLKGIIDYLKESEIGIRDEFGHLRPVPLGGIREFDARNNTTKLRTASSNWWWRTAKLLWRHMNPTSFDGLTA
jgi:hypothetical protein